MANDLGRASTGAGGEPVPSASGEKAALIAAWTAFAPRERPCVTHWEAFSAGWNARSVSNEPVCRVCDGHGQTRWLTEAGDVEVEPCGACQPWYDPDRDTEEPADVRDSAAPKKPSALPQAEPIPPCDPAEAVLMELVESLTEGLSEDRGLGDDDRTAMRWQIIALCEALDRIRDQKPDQPSTGGE